MVLNYMIPVSWSENLCAWTASGKPLRYELQPNCMNREDSFSQSKAWKPLIHILNKKKKDLLKAEVSHDQLSGGCL
jgi:hypothetical protein